MPVFIFGRTGGGMMAGRCGWLIEATCQQGRAARDTAALRSNRLTAAKSTVLYF